MNSTSFLIVIISTAIGAAALYLAVMFGMDASDDYASRLSTTSTEYLRDRERAADKGKDPNSIPVPAARSQRPQDYDPSLVSANTSPYVRADSDKVDVTTVSGEQAPGDAQPSVQISIDDPNAVALAPTGGTGEGSTNPDTETTGTERAVTQQTTSVASKPYTVNDEIRRQLRDDDLSDTKRAALEELLPREKPKPVRAIDVRLQFDPNGCVVPKNSNSWIGVLFRSSSSAIRGASLTELDDLVRLRERCEGTLVIEHYAFAKTESDLRLRESRQEEVKYYLLQRRVPKDSIQVITP